jgi:hypothetical protein
MKTATGILTLVAAALVLTPLAGFAQGRGGAAGAGQHQAPAGMERGQSDFDRDWARGRSRAEDPAYDRDRDRTQDRTHVPDFAKLSDQDIYGSELMTDRERNVYRKKLEKADNAKERAKIEARHEKTMQVRAEKQGVDIAPPGKGIYGGAMMTVEERNAYREELRLVGQDPEKRTKFMADHKEKMQLRAKAQGLTLGEEAEEAE